MSDTVTRDEMQRALIKAGYVSDIISDVLYIVFPPRTPRVVIVCEECTGCDCTDDQLCMGAYKSREIMSDE